MSWNIVPRFHPACIGKTIKEAKKLENFTCEGCVAENGNGNGVKNENSHESTGESDEKVSNLML